jgi:hypothetical protein
MQNVKNEDRMPDRPYKNKKKARGYKEIKFV